MTMEKMLSSDSLYIHVQLPSGLPPVKLEFNFSNDNSKTVSTSDTLVRLSKLKHLFPKRLNTVNRNHIGFSSNADISGTELYRSRIMFEIFEEDIDTEKLNYITISLPNFDLCFFSFESYNQELIYVKKQNELIWQGTSWKNMR
jgi:hypothetical protein